MENIRIQILDVGDGLREITSLLNCCYDFFDYNDATPMSVSSVPLRTMTGIAVADPVRISDKSILHAFITDVLCKNFAALIHAIPPPRVMQIIRRINYSYMVNWATSLMNIRFRSLNSDRTPDTIPLNPQNHEKNYLSADPAIGSSFP